MAMAQNYSARGPQVLVHVSTYQGSILGLPYFDPQTCGWNFPGRAIPCVGYIELKYLNATSCPGHYSL